MSRNELRVHAMRDARHALCGRVIGSKRYNGGIGQLISDQESAAQMRRLGVDCILCLKSAEKAGHSQEPGSKAMSTPRDVADRLRMLNHQIEALEFALVRLRKERDESVTGAGAPPPGDAP